MPQYCIIYLGGAEPSSDEEGKQQLSEYWNWLSSLGDSAVSPANPLKNTSTVNSDGSVTSGGKTSISGFTIIEADSMGSALSIAKSCPYLKTGGSLEVSELNGTKLRRLFLCRAEFIRPLAVGGYPHSGYIRDDRWYGNVGGRMNSTLQWVR